MSDYCEGGIRHFRHHMPLQMRFNDIDMLGHLNNSVYLTFMDLAKTRYFQAVLGDKLRWGEIGVVIVNINCDFCAPTFFDDVIEVETAVVAVGEKSLTLEQRVYSPDDERVRCRCRTIMSGFNTKTLKSEPISDEWREALEQYEGHKFDKEA
ncbi:MAG: acyl-CoA thioesterase [Duncaniella sp.]|nr:acyl-CoA thioesterase [Duncaniella sp.]